MFDKEKLIALLIVIAVIIIGYWIDYKIAVSDLSPWVKYMLLSPK